MMFSAQRQQSPWTGEHRGGFGTASRENPEGWIVESTCFHRLNTAIYKLVSGDQQKLLIKAYLPP